MGIEEFVKKVKKTLDTPDEAINRRLGHQHRLFQLVVAYICELLKKDATIPIHIGEITKAWGMARTTTCRQFEWLESQGLIERDKEHTGYYHYHAVLNEKGRPKILKYEKRIKEALGL